MLYFKQYYGSKDDVFWRTMFSVMWLKKMALLTADILLSAMYVKSSKKAIS